MKYLFIFFFLVFAYIGLECKSGRKEKEDAPQQLNISILLDLSDRIEAKKHPFMVQVDTESVKTIISIFKQKLNEIGVYDAKSKIKVVFYPPPENDSLVTIAKKLNFDLNKTDSSTMQGVSDRIRMFQSIDSIFMTNLAKLYQFTSQKNEYPGADIFTFFKNDVEDQCIESDISYRNILIIITDGYIYWDKNLHNPQGKRYTYITAKTPQVTRFRNMKNWETVFDNEDYGVVKINKDLSQLEVLVLSIDPVIEEDYDIIKKYWTKWLLEMNVNSSNIKIIKAELPVRTNIIEKFFYRNK